MKSIVHVTKSTTYNVFLEYSHHTGTEVRLHVSFKQNKIKMTAHS